METGGREGVVGTVDDRPRPGSIRGGPGYTGPPVTRTSRVSGVPPINPHQPTRPVLGVGMEEVEDEETPGVDSGSVGYTTYVTEGRKERSWRSPWTWTGGDSDNGPPEPTTSGKVDRFPLFRTGTRPTGQGDGVS